MDGTSGAPAQSEKGSRYTFKPRIQRTLSGTGTIQVLIKGPIVVQFTIGGDMTQSIDMYHGAAVAIARYSM
jgi:hypothetical protein